MWSTTMGAVKGWKVRTILRAQAEEGPRGADLLFSFLFLIHALNVQEPLMFSMCTLSVFTINVIFNKQIMYLLFQPHPSPHNGSFLLLCLSLWSELPSVLFIALVMQRRQWYIHATYIKSQGIKTGKKREDITLKSTVCHTVFQRER